MPCCSENLELTTVTLEKKNGTGAYGVRLVDTEDKEAGLMIMFIPEGGALSQWIERNPSAGVAPGDSIVSVNGITAPWEIMEEMAKSVSVEMVVRRAAPGAMALLSQCYVTDRTLKTTALVLKRTVRAGDISMDSCAICMEDVEADERVAGLQCGHGFHQRCIVRWLARHGTCGCPLCREVVQCQ
jgi:predicted metalloprotease with PDZ domain